MSIFNIKVDFQNNIYNFTCQEDQDIISAAKLSGLELPSSCCAGVCTSCASLIENGIVEQDNAMGLNDDLKKRG